MMTFEELQNKLLLAVGTIFVSGMAYIIVTVLNAPSRDDVERMIRQGMDSNPYVQERISIQRSIEDLYTTIGKLGAEHERFKTLIEASRDRLSDHASKMDARLLTMGVELERLKLQIDYHDSKKKARGNDYMRLPEE